MTSALELRGVSKVYGAGPGEVHALRDVDLGVEVGELVAIMGPSGWGKSTLLTIAGSLETPTTGDVFVAGADVAALSANDRARLRRRTIGYVFQDFIGVLARTVGPIRSESAEEMRTLTATGATSRTRRTITATTAGPLGLLGVLLGTVTAYLALVGATPAGSGRWATCPSPI